VGHDALAITHKVQDALEVCRVSVHKVDAVILKHKKKW
jgi:hypothetical protein